MAAISIQKTDNRSNRAPDVWKSTDVWTIIGKRGTGKTYLATAILRRLIDTLRVMPGGKKYLGIILSTKGDPMDLSLWKRQGFEVLTPEKLPQHKKSLVVVTIEAHKGRTVSQLSQIVIEWAFRRTHTILLIDEYTQVVESRSSPGEALYHAFAQGRGRHIGIIGLTQEPVMIPRQLLSQCSKLFLFDCAHPRDVEYLRLDFCREYHQPPDPHGFFYRDLDGSRDWEYIPDLKILEARLPGLPVQTQG